MPPMCMNKQKNGGKAFPPLLYFMRRVRICQFPNWEILSQTTGFFQAFPVAENAARRLDAVRLVIAPCFCYNLRRWPVCRNGRRGRLKIFCGQPRGGSSPFTGTMSSPRTSLSSRRFFCGKTPLTRSVAAPLASKQALKRVTRQNEERKTICGLR